ncbi:IS5 family transposase, partial [archaeon]
DMKVAQQNGYIQKIPCFASVGHFIQDGELTPIIKDLIRISSLPLKAIESDVAIDSTGFTTTRFARWFDHKYGKEIDKRVWIKAHVMSGTKTNIITAVEVTPTPEHDSKFLPQLLVETAENFQVNEVSADKGYSSRENLEAISNAGAMPYIPFRKNTTSKALGSSTWHKMWYYFMFKHDEFLQHYHKRSNAETVFHMVKSKFGDHVRSKTETAQVNEVLLKLLCHNICVVIQEMNELGIKPDFFAGRK